MGVLGGGRAAGDAAEGVVAEAAAAVVAGDDAAELADHRFIVNFPRELAIGTVAVDLLSEQHGAAAFLLMFAPIIHAFREIAMVLFAKKQRAHRAQQQNAASPFQARLSGKRRRPLRCSSAATASVQEARPEAPCTAGAASRSGRLLHGGAALRQNAYAAEGQKRRRDAQLH